MYTCTACSCIGVKHTCRMHSVIIFKISCWQNSQIGQFLNVLCSKSYLARAEGWHSVLHGHVPVQDASFGQMDNLGW